MACFTSVVPVGNSVGLWTTQRLFRFSVRCEMGFDSTTLRDGGEESGDPRVTLFTIGVCIEFLCGIKSDLCLLDGALGRPRTEGVALTVS